MNTDKHRYFAAFNLRNMKFSYITHRLLVLALFVTVMNTAYSQVNSAAYGNAQQVLSDKGISQEQLKAKLTEKGIDVDNISPEELPQLEGTIQQAIEEIEAENGQNTGNGVVEDLSTNNELSKENLEDKFDNLDEIETEDIESSIDDEMSVEEAVSDFNAEHLNEDETPIYGHSLFFNQSLDFYRTTKSSSTPDYYILDVGDKITINIFGLSQADLIYQVENDGFIRPTGMYKIYLKGLTIAKARDLLFKRFQQAYSFKKGEFNVDVNTARTVTVSIYGEVNNPGTYTLSALNSSLSAIIAAGGPTAKGSIRGIKLIAGSTENIIDVYDFISSPSAIKNYGLRNNMVIFIPPIQNVVSLSGPFTHTGKFEMKETETLADLIAIAGGIRKGTVINQFNMVRNNGVEDQLTTYDYQTNKAMKLEDLDEISFKSVSIAYENYVKVTGAIRYPGEYQYIKGMTLKSLMKQVEIEDYARLDIGYLTRRNLDGTSQLISFRLDSNAKDIVLQERDELFVFNQRSFTRTYTFSIAGAVKNERIRHFVDRDQTMRLSDAILLAGGLQDNAMSFAYIMGRSVTNSKKSNYKIVPITDIFSNPTSPWNVTIAPYDSVFIPFQESFIDEQFIEIKGAVRQPRKLVYDESLKLKDLILKAGGLTREASTNRVDLFRLEINDNKPTRTLFTSVTINRALNPTTQEDRITLQPSDIVVVRKVPEFEPLKLVTIEGEVTYPGDYAVTVGKETIRDLINKAGGLTQDAYLGNSTLFRSEDNSGFVFLDFEKVMKKNSSHNLILAENDKVFVGKKVDLVTILESGTNAAEFVVERLQQENKISVPFKKNRSARYYINKYTGGFAKDAKPSRTFVRQLDGKLLKTHNFIFFNVHRKVKRGSEIVVSLKDIEEKEESKKRRAEKSKINLKDAAMEMMSVVVSAFTVITMAQNL